MTTHSGEIDEEHAPVRAGTDELVIPDDEGGGDTEAIEEAPPARRPGKASAKARQWNSRIFPNRPRTQVTPTGREEIPTSVTPTDVHGNYGVFIDAIRRERDTSEPYRVIGLLLGVDEPKPLTLAEAAARTGLSINKVFQLGTANISRSVDGLGLATREIERLRSRLPTTMPIMAGRGAMPTTPPRREDTDDRLLPDHSIAETIAALEKPHSTGDQIADGVPALGIHTPTIPSPSLPTKGIEMADTPTEDPQPVTGRKGQRCDPTANPWDEELRTLRAHVVELEAMLAERNTAPIQATVDPPVDMPAGPDEDGAYVFQGMRLAPRTTLPSLIGLAPEMIEPKLFGKHIRTHLVEYPNGRRFLLYSTKDVERSCRQILNLPVVTGRATVLVLKGEIWKSPEMLLRMRLLGEPVWKSLMEVEIWLRRYPNIGRLKARWPRGNRRTLYRDRDVAFVLQKTL